MPERRQPQRTCVGCRETAGRRELIRVVRTPDGGVAVDATGRAAGRGAYVHPSLDCVRQAMKRKALDRSLRAPLSEREAARLLGDLSERLGAQG